MVGRGNALCVSFSKPQTQVEIAEEHLNRERPKSPNLRALSVLVQYVPKRDVDLRTMETLLPVIPTPNSSNFGGILCCSIMSHLVP